MAQKNAKTRKNQTTQKINARANSRKASLTQELSLFTIKHVPNSQPSLSHALNQDPQDALLLNRVYKQACVIWGSSVLLLKDEKKTATLRSTIKGVMKKWRKNRELFSLEVNHL
jgi:hypothetical protein